MEDIFPPGGILPLNIKSDEAHALARLLAEKKGQTITDAVTSALRDAISRIEDAETKSANRIISDLNAIAQNCASLEILDDRPADVILGYDERGLPR